MSNVELSNMKSCSWGLEAWPDASLQLGRYFASSKFQILSQWYLVAQVAFATAASWIWTWESFVCVCVYVWFSLLVATAVLVQDYIVVSCSFLPVFPGCIHSCPSVCCRSTWLIAQPFHLNPPATEAFTSQDSVVDGFRLDGYWSTIW